MENSEIENIKEQFRKYLYFDLDLSLETADAITNITYIVGGFGAEFLKTVSQMAVELLPENAKKNYRENNKYYEYLFILITQTKFFNGVNRDRRDTCKNCINEDNVKEVLYEINNVKDFTESKPLGNYNEEIAVLGSTFEMMELSTNYAIKEIKRVNKNNRPVKLTILTGDRKVFANELINNLIFKAESYEEILSLNKLTQEQIVFINNYRKSSYSVSDLKRNLLEITEYNMARILRQDLINRRKVPFYVEVDIEYTNKRELNENHSRTEDTIKYQGCKTFVTIQPFILRQRRQIERITNYQVEVFGSSAGSTLWTNLGKFKGFDVPLKIPRFAPISIKTLAAQTITESMANLFFSYFENKHTKEEVELVKKVVFEIKKKLGIAVEEQQNSNNKELKEANKEKIRGQILKLTQSFRVKSKKTRKSIGNLSKNYTNMSYQDILLYANEIFKNIQKEWPKNRIVKYVIEEVFNPLLNEPLGKNSKVDKEQERK